MQNDSQYELGRRIFARHSSMIARPLHGLSGLTRLPLLDAVRRRTGLGKLLPDNWFAPVFTGWPFLPAGRQAIGPGMTFSQLPRGDSATTPIVSAEPLVSAAENSPGVVGTQSPSVQRREKSEYRAELHTDCGSRVHTNPVPRDCASIDSAPQAEADRDVSVAPLEQPRVVLAAGTRTVENSIPGKTIGSATAARVDTGAASDSTIRRATGDHVVASDVPEVTLRAGTGDEFFPQSSKASVGAPNAKAIGLAPKISGKPDLVVHAEPERVALGAPNTLVLPTANSSGNDKPVETMNQAADASKSSPVVSEVGDGRFGVTGAQPNAVTRMPEDSGGGIVHRTGAVSSSAAPGVTLQGDIGPASTPAAKATPIVETSARGMLHRVSMPIEVAAPDMHPGGMGTGPQPINAALPGSGVVPAIVSRGSNSGSQEASLEAAALGQARGDPSLPGAQPTQALPIERRSFGGIVHRKTDTTLSDARLSEKSQGQFGDAHQSFPSDKRDSHGRDEVATRNSATPQALHRKFDADLDSLVLGKSSGESEAVRQSTATAAIDSLSGGAATVQPVAHSHEIDSEYSAGSSLIHRDGFADSFADGFADVGYAGRASGTSPSEKIPIQTVPNLIDATPAAGIVQRVTNGAVLADPAAGMGFQETIHRKAVAQIGVTSDTGSQDISTRTSPETERRVTGSLANPISDTLAPVMVHPVAGTLVRSEAPLRGEAEGKSEFLGERPVESPTPQAVKEYRLPAEAVLPTSKFLSAALPPKGEGFGQSALIHRRQVEEASTAGGLGQQALRGSRMVSTAPFRVVAATAAPSKPDSVLQRHLANSRLPGVEIVERAPGSTAVSSRASHNETSPHTGMSCEPQRVQALDRFIFRQAAGGDGAMPLGTRNEAAEAGSVPIPPPIFPSGNTFSGQRASAPMSEVEVRRLADKVYQLLVRRIASEKERRGSNDGI